MVDERSIGPWPVESVPDGDTVYMRIHRTWIKPDGSIGRGAFQNHGRGMSVDWSRYTTAEETQRRAKNPIDNAVVELMAGQIRSIPGQSVEHSPLPDNRAHSDVVGEKDEEVRVKLGRLAEWVIRLDSAV